MKKLVFILFIPLFTLGQSKDGFLIKGTFSGLKDSTTVFLMNPNDGKTVATDMAKNGTFTLRGNLADPSLLQLGFGGHQEGLELFIQNDVVTITGDADKIMETKIKGSVLQEDFIAFRQQIVVPYIDKLRPLGAAIKVETDTRKKDSLVNEYNAYRIKALDATSTFTRNKPFSPVSSLVLAVMMPGMESVTDLENRYNQLQAAAKKGYYARAIEKAISDTKAAQAQAQAQAQAVQVGQIGTQAIDFTQKDVDGKAITLSSFRGKYVLVDFWASWCRPCRMENPNVVNAYNQYKNKNFTVLGVSLDQVKPNWVQAIQADNLTWTHVSDLQYWNNAVAQLYHIGSIPANILIDPNGKIIGRDLRGEDLNRKLNELLK